MDIALIRTFLEVAASGSFAHAADRLFVTQSAVSLRVKRLEDTLGKPLFTRSKAGAEMTPAGIAFHGYATSLVRVWEEARQQVAIPEGFSRAISIGAEYSLWPRLGFRWIDALRSNAPDLSVRADLGMSDRLTRFLVEGALDAALLYAPQLRPGLTAHQALEDELVLVAGWPDPTLDLGARYVFVDWGPEFVQAHAAELGTLTHTGLTLSLGAMASRYVVSRRLAAYLPARTIKPDLDAGRLHLVPEAPVFPYPAWAVFRDDIEPGLADLARETLAATARRGEAETEAVMDTLEEISEAQLHTLGDLPPPHP